MAVDFSLKGKVAIVTGASRGIGKSIATTLAMNGATVVLTSRKQDALDDVAEELKQQACDALGIACHTGKMAMIDELYASVKDTFGRVDILVNNAATNPYFGDLLNIDETAYDKTFEVNVKGYFFMAQKAAQIMAEQESGSIINISSIAGISPPPMQGVYGMTKAAVISMTKAFARELAPYNIRANAICPGLTETKFARVLIDTESIYDVALSGIPLGRHAQPDEMAGAALYLASDASSFTTGSVIVVDGGATI